MEKSFEKSQVNFIGRTLLHMGIGLLLTFVVAYLTPMILDRISYVIIIGASILEIGLVLYLTARIKKMSIGKATFWFYVYAALNGFTLSIILANYGFGKVGMVFLLTSAMFFSSAMIGITTKKDLSIFGQFFMMLLMGLLIITVFQIFVPLQGLNFIIAIIGIIVFCGLTAYDMQKIKHIHAQSYSIDAETASKYAIIAALGLYLDFINLFLYVLRLFKDK
jgi:FtsH-binding integral membrane protein